MELSSLIKKIGHSLVEIRVRALRNIRSKLDHGLVSAPDLVQERELFMFLLEWFNFPEVPLQEEVLDLLSMLSKHPSGAQMLRDVGAAEFLTQLKPNVEPQLQTIIDSIFDQLFHLSELPLSCPPATAYEPQWGPPCQPEDEWSTTGYFHQSQPTQTEAPPPRAAVNSAVRWLKFSTFPWLQLTTTDRHILASNESSLRSNDRNLVRTTCELLRDVIMLDFPAEIFLQRPSTVQSLLSLLSLNVENEARYLTLQALACLHQLCSNLRSRLRFHRDPSFCTAKQDAVSQNSSMSYSQEHGGAPTSAASSPEEFSPRPSVVGRTGLRVRGDGQDGDAGSTSSSSSSQRGAPPPAGPLPSPQPQARLDLPEPEAEEPADLQLQQWSLAQFGVAVLEHALPLLRAESLRLFQRTMGLLAEVLPLLGDSLAHELWEEPCLIAMELRERLQACLDVLGDITCHHDSSPSELPEPTLVFQRTAFMCTAIFTVRLLQTLLPVEKALENLPENTVGALFLLCLDTPFSLAFPGVHETAVAYLEQAGPESCAVYRRAARAAHSLEATCSFLKEAEANDGEKNWLELLDLADQAIVGLPNHQHLPVVRKCVQICSYLWRFAEASPLLQTESQKIFLKLLSHPLLPVKKETYASALDVVKGCLGVQNAAKSNSAICSGANFLLHSRVLYEIGAFGLQDQAREVNAAAREILLYLLKGRPLMTAPTWSRFNEALVPVLPILQSYAGAEDALGTCVLLISEPADETGDDAPPPPTARLRAALRLLFTKQHTVRNIAAQHLVAHLARAEGAHGTVPALDHRALSALPSLYCLNKTVDIKLDNPSRSLLKVECVNKLYSILASETVDVVLRRSAAEQLCVVLQDAAMHAVLLDLGVVDKLLSLITESVNHNSMDAACPLEPCLAMLRKLVYADPSLRRGLAQRPPFLLLLLRASLLMKENRCDVGEPAALMCFLLFDELAQVDAWSDPAETDAAPCPFSLPVSVVRRYSLPFLPASHHAVSPHCTVLPPHSDLRGLRPAWDMLRWAWNRAWYGGVDDLLDALRGHRSDPEGFHADLALSAAQGVLLGVSDVGSALRDCVRAVRSAASHAAVAEALARMQLHLLTDRLALQPASHSSRNVLRSLDWHAAMERFLTVQPASGRDERLLADVAAFLGSFFRHEREDDSADLEWMVGLLQKQETSTLLDLLPGTEGPPPARAPTQGEEEEELASLVSQRLQRELTGLFNSLLLRLSHTSDRLCVALAGPLETQLASRLLRCVRVCDGPSFYGLPSLERTLRTMVRLTALPGWSAHSPGLEPHHLCLKYLSGLLEVISSFYVEWGGNSMSFMGKGVTKNTVICLLHLSHEMMAESTDKDWMSLWSLGHEQSPDEQSPAHMGLAWLIPLWVDRDPEVRCASLALGAALSSLESGCVALAASCQNISGGLWATLLNILLEPQESAMVRREAAFILQNLLVMPMPANTEEAKDASWQSPCVHDELSGVALVGLPALQALLYHCRFFEHVQQAATSCYLGRHAFPLTAPAGHCPPAASTEDLSDSLSHWRSCPERRSASPAASSASTVSTLILPGGSTGRHTPVPPSSAAAPPDPPASRLTAQGQSDTDSSQSAMSQDSRAADGSSPPVAIVTPCLVAALCGLLDNLLAVLPEFTLSALAHHAILPALASLVDAAAIEKCVGELRTPALLPGDEEDARKQALSLMRFLSSFSQLLQSVALLGSAELPAQLPFLQPLLAHVIAVLTLDGTHLDSRARGGLRHTWTRLFTLLATLVRRSAAAVCPSVTAALGRRWQLFSGTVRVCARQGEEDPGLYTACLHFLCALFCEEAKKRGAEGGPSGALAEILLGPTAEDLCDLLLQRLEKTSSQDPLKNVTAHTLMALLACSPAAQTFACKAGLIDNAAEQLKQIYAQLHLESLNPGKSASRRKEESCLKELKMTLEILRNCLYQNAECKAAAVELRLAMLLLPLWPWLLLEERALTAALELLCVYTANCAAACSSLCGVSSSHSLGPAPVPRAGPSGSLMHCVMRLASPSCPDSGPIHALAFSLLASLAISRDCKGLLHKSNFLQHFLSVAVPRRGARAGWPEAERWLRLLLNVSFGEDGQRMILRLQGGLELLTELAGRGPRAGRPTALLALHNVCFCPANKPKVLASDPTVRLLVSCLDAEALDVRAIGASALWALLHNNQKAKATLKYPFVRLKVEGAYTSAKKASTDGEQRDQQTLNAYLIKCLGNLSQLLNT